MVHWRLKQKLRIFRYLKVTLENWSNFPVMEMHLWKTTVCQRAWFFFFFFYLLISPLILMVHYVEHATGKKDVGSGGASLDTAMYMSWFVSWLRAQGQYGALWTPSVLPSEAPPSALPSCWNKAMLLKTQTITGILYHKGYTFSMSHFSYVAYKIPVLSWVFRAKCLRVFTPDHLHLAQQQEQLQGATWLRPSKAALKHFWFWPLLFLCLEPDVNRHL